MKWKKKQKVKRNWVISGLLGRSIKKNSAFVIQTMSGVSEQEEQIVVSVGGIPVKTIIVRCN
jgi:hypothetical protein